jgi:hypothetical protein
MGWGERHCGKTRGRPASEGGRYNDPGKERKALAGCIVKAAEPPPGGLLDLVISGKREPELPHSKGKIYLGPGHLYRVFEDGRVWY